MSDSPVASNSTAPAAAVDSSASEAPVESSSGGAVSSDDFSARFAALSRQEKFLQQEKSKIKELESKYAAYQDLEGQVKTKPSLVLEKYGISLDDLIADQYNLKRELTPEEQLQKKIEELENRFSSKEEQERAAKEAALEAQRKEQEEAQAAAIAGHQKNIAAFIEANADNYEITKILGQQDLIWEITEAQYLKDGTLLSIKDASDKAESYLMDQVKLVLGSSKVQQLLMGSKNDKSKSIQAIFETTEVDTRESRPASKTLTSTFVSSNTAAPSSPGKLSVEESKRRAAAFLQQALNSKK